MKSAISFGKLLAQPIEGHVDSMLACPFFSAGDDDALAPRVNFVLFADTSDRSFFADDRLRLIYAACKGFVDNIEESLAELRLRQISTAYSGYQSRGPLASDEIQRLGEVGISFDNEVFTRYLNDLTFRNLRSTELDDAFGIFR